MTPDLFTIAEARIAIGVVALTAGHVVHLCTRPALGLMTRSSRASSSHVDDTNARRGPGGIGSSATGAVRGGDGRETVSDF